MESMLSLSICILLITLFVMEQVMFQRTSCLVLILFLWKYFISCPRLSAGQMEQPVALHCMKYTYFTSGRWFSKEYFQLDLNLHCCQVCNACCGTPSKPRCGVFVESCVVQLFTSWCRGSVFLYGWLLFSHVYPLQFFTMLSQNTFHSSLLAIVFFIECQTACSQWLLADGNHESAFISMWNRWRKNGGTG